MSTSRTFQSFRTTIEPSVVWNAPCASPGMVSAQPVLDPQDDRDHGGQEGNAEEFDLTETGVQDGVDERWPVDIGQGERGGVHALDGDAHKRGSQQDGPREPKQPADSSGPTPLPPQERDKNSQPDQKQETHKGGDADEPVDGSHRRAA